MPRGVLPRGALRKRGALVRDVIADALCGPNGYFATRLPVLASHTALPFREMKGRADYERALRERYAERAGRCIDLRASPHAIDAMPAPALTDCTQERAS